MKAGRVESTARRFTCQRSFWPPQRLHDLTGLDLSQIARCKSLVSSVAAENPMLVRPSSRTCMSSIQRGNGTKDVVRRLRASSLSRKAEASAIGHQRQSPIVLNERSKPGCIGKQDPVLLWSMVWTMLRRGLHVFGAPKQSTTQRLDFLLGESRSHLCFDSDQLLVRSNEDFGSFAR